MTQSTPLPSYSELAAALASSDSTFQAAEAHGFMCGLICATAGSASNWQKLIIGQHANPQSTELLQELYENSYHQMSEFSFEFSLLLPNDTEDINWRTECLGLWCQGFLTGLSQAKTPIEASLSPDAADALHDIIEIGEVSYGEIAGTDADETAYFELEEYVRLIALMLFHELKLPPEERLNDTGMNDSFDEDLNDPFDNEES